MDLKETYNRIADDWANDHRGDTWWIGGLEKFVTLFKEGDTVLDVGCGAGHKAKFLSDRGLKVVGIDFSEKMVEIAKRNDANSRFFVGDILDLSSLEEKFDGILAQAILLHIPKTKIAGVIRGLFEKLNNGGYLFVAVKEIGPDGKGEKMLSEEDYGYKYERFFSFFSPLELKKYLTDQDLAIVHEDVVSSGRSNWIQIIGQKKG